MGPCRICAAPAPFGYGRPADYRTGFVWACSAHRAEVEAQWAAKFDPNNRNKIEGD